MNTRILAIVFCLLTAGISTASADPAIWYVDDSQTAECNAQEGTSWSKAYKCLQDMLADPSLQAGDTIRLAQGTYRPDETCATPGGSGDRTLAFALVNRVIIEGGYNGIGSVDPDGRSPDRTLTILSGDLDDDDEGDFDDSSRAENSYVVVTAGYLTDPVDNFTRLEDVTIRDGHNYSGGGGLFVQGGNDASNPTIINCFFTRNYSLGAGGAVYLDSATALIGDPTPLKTTFTSCRFENNAALYSGGAVHAGKYTEVSFTSADFVDNVGGGDGGGAFFGERTESTFLGCTFTRNDHKDVSGLGGGAIATDFGAAMTIKKCIFTANRTVSSGGAIEIQAKEDEPDTQVIIVNSSFEENISEGSGAAGGAIYSKTKDNTFDVFNCTFSGNQAISTSEDPSIGGAITMTTGTNCHLTNCLFFDNVADKGGAIHTDASDLKLFNCTLVENLGNTKGGGIYQVGTGSVTRLFNTILWDNNDAAMNKLEAQIYHEQTSAVVSAEHSCIEDDSPGGTIPFGGPGGPNYNIDSDPIFVDHTNRDYRLSVGSPCIDSGEDAKVPDDIGDVDENTNFVESVPLDLRSQERFFHDNRPLVLTFYCDDTGPVDRGAFEFRYDYASASGCEPNDVADEDDIATCDADPECEDIDLNDDMEIDVVMDCDGNAQLDLDQISANSSLDCNENCILDVCERAADTPASLVIATFTVPTSYGAFDTSGDWILIGSPDDGDLSPTGAIYFFEDLHNGTWDGPRRTSSNSHAYSEFGASVSINGGWAVAGAPADGATYADTTGRAFVFKYDSINNTWNSYGSALQASTPTSSGGFGKTVSIWGNTIAVAAAEDDDNSTEDGIVYVFEESSGVWSGNGVLLPQSGATQFGRAISVGDDWIAVGYVPDEEGTLSGVDVFHREEGDWVLTQTLTYCDSDPESGFGVSLAIDSESGADHMIVGACNLDGTGYGRAYVFELDSDVWYESSVLAGAGASADDRFGLQVDLFGETALVGAKYKGSTNTGAAYLFSGSPRINVLPQLTITAPSPGTNHYFGAFVGLRDGGGFVVRKPQSATPVVYEFDIEGISCP